MAVTRDQRPANSNLQILEVSTKPQKYAIDLDVLDGDRYLSISVTWRRPRIRRSDWRPNTKKNKRGFAQAFALQTPRDGLSPHPRWADNIDFIRRGSSLRSRDDSHVDRAGELLPDHVDLDEVDRRHLKWAGWILYCDHPNYFLKKKCGCRACPTCSRRIQWTYQLKVLAKIGPMANPVLYMAQVYSHRLDDKFDLSETIDTLQTAFNKLYERKLFRAGRSAAGFIEVVPARERHGDEHGPRWNTHLHVVLDVGPEGIDVEAANLEWQEIIGHRSGQFSIDDKVKSKEALSTYMTKRSSWSPDPGRLSKDLLMVLFYALYRRHLLVFRKPR